MAKEKKEKKDASKDWVNRWCKEHLEDLRRLSHGWATIHPEHGIVNYDTLSMLHLIGRNRFIKRSIMKECVHIDVAKTVFDLKPRRKVWEPPTPEEMAEAVKKTKYEPKAWTKKSEPGDPQKRATPAGIPSLHDPFDTPQELEERVQMTLARFAQSRGIKATEVLIFLLSEGAEGVHINSILDDAWLKLLNEKWPAALPKEATESPHKQPPFQPMQHDPYDRDFVVDGGGAAWRNRTRFD